MGWDPIFLTKELQHIFEERNDNNDASSIASSLVHDKQVNSVFQELVQEMQVAIRTASLQMKQDQEFKMMTDLEKGGGGDTRVVPVQYSEFEITPDGKKTSVTSGGCDRAPEASTMMEEEAVAPAQTLTEEE